MNDVAPLLGVLAGVVGVVGMIPYLRNTIRRSTRPHRGTWLIWGVLATVVCLSQRADGGSWSLIMAGTGAVMAGLVLVLALRFGTGGWSAWDSALITLAGAGVAGWLVIDEPVVATLCVVVADLIAAGMMVPKTWRDPESETLSTFAFASLGGGLTAGCVGAFELSLLLYPAYYCMANGALALMIRHRRAALAWIHRPDGVTSPDCLPQAPPARSRGLYPRSARRRPLARPPARKHSPVRWIKA